MLHALDDLTEGGVLAVKRVGIVCRGFGDDKELRGRRVEGGFDIGHIFVGNVVAGVQVFLEGNAVVIRKSAARARHGDGALYVLDARVDAVIEKLALNVLFRAARAIALGVAALDHEALDDAVEGEAVIKAVVHKLFKVCNGDGCFVCANETSPSTDVDGKFVLPIGNNVITDLVINVFFLKSRTDTLPKPI